MSFWDDLGEIGVGVSGGPSAYYLYKKCRILPYRFCSIETL
jgi:hypothetical protein